MVWGGSGAAQWYVTWSVSWVRVLRVNKWEALEFFLVQVGYKLLIWGGQLGGVAREKAIKVLRLTPTLPWRGEMEREGWEREAGGGWSEIDEGCRGQNDSNEQQREKREIQLKHGINQSDHSQPKLWSSIGPHGSQRHLGSSLVTTLTNLISAFVRVVSNDRRWLGLGDERSNLCGDLPRHGIKLLPTLRGHKFYA